MRLRRVPLIVALLFSLAAPGQALAKKHRAARRARSHRLICAGKGRHHRCWRRGKRWITGHGVAESHLRKDPLPESSGEIRVYSVNLKIEADVNIYNPDGSFNESALAQLDKVFQCRRTHEVRAVDPRLYRILSIIYDHFGKRRVELTSGFRFQRNEGSRHFHASAMDIKVPGVRAKDLYNFADSLDRGGMGVGLYPRDGFVHVDFRAPGEKSYRWTDQSRGKTRDPGKIPSRLWRRRSAKPNT